MAVVALIGANGQLGSDLARKLKENHTLVSLAHADVDITHPAELTSVFDRVKPEIVINTAAYHKVDEVEDNPAKAFDVNGLGIRNLALECRRTGAVLVHLSTDYVFSGEKGAPYSEEDAPEPVNVYGISKLAGEYFIRYLLDRYFIVRTSGLYGVAGSSGKGGNFIELMLRLAQENREIKVVNDQVLTPTYTVDLAQKIVELIGTRSYGLCHLTNRGECSWFEFARAIFELSGLSPRLLPTTTSAFGAKARRPAYSVLAHTKLSQAGLPDLRPWREALGAYLVERKQK
jgi:dTDP-4-dehydrorhamnose reductase